MLGSLFSDPYAEQKKAEQLAAEAAEQKKQARTALLANIAYKEIPIGNLEQSIKSTTTDGSGFIVKAYVLHPDWMYFSVGSKQPEVQIVSYGGFSINAGDKIPDGISVGAQSFDGTYPNIYKQLESDRQYTVYIAVLKEDNYGRDSESYHGIVTKIDGLRSVEEVVATGEAKKEASRKAEETANKYDASKFTIVPSSFKPADYEKIDLFAAVAKVEKMPRGSAGTLDAVLNVYEFVSDVTFVSQNGTNIQFKTSDGAISQYMKVESRSGLTTGQKVRLYYKVSKNPLTEWTVVAIQRL
ncbi:hypothetical protein FACS1894190_12140 [Spirochaetia bacterium]|nr:hypothetical protein FACS1894190_12140 [Spirochaetia bacterium]